MVWHLPPAACVHVTHATWKIESKYEESERMFPLVVSNKKRTIQWKKGKEKKRKEKKKRKKGEENKRDEENLCVKEKGERKEKGSDSQYSDGRKSIGQELKLVYSTRATSRCQKTKDVGFSPTLVPLNLRVVNGCVVQPQP